MSMTETFKKYWRLGSSRVPITLARLAFPAPSTDMLIIASQEVVLPDGSIWESGFKGGTLSEKVGMLDTGPNPCDASCQIANRLYPFMTSGVAADTLATHKWQGATITIWFWNDVRDASGNQLLAATDKYQVYEGVVDAFDYDDNWIYLNLLQSRSWNRRAPNRRIDNSSWPNATDVALGIAEPVVMGDFSAFPMRAPHTTSYGNKSVQEDSGGGRGAIPLLVVDPGLGSANVKLLAAGHECADLLNRSGGLTAFIVANDVLAPLDTAGITETLASGGSYLSINDDALIAYYGVRAIDVRTGAGNNTAGNPRRAMDVFDETTYAELDQATGKTALELVLPNVGSLGTIESVDVLVSFSGNGSNTHQLRAYPRNSVSTATGTVVSATSTTATPTTLSGAWASAWWSANWEFGAVTGGQNPVNLRVDFAGGTTNKAKIHHVALRVKHRPQRSLVTPQASHLVPVTRPVYYGRGGYGGRNHFDVIVGYNPVEDLPASYEIGGQFYGHVKGAPDTAGTYTGTVGALIQRPPDMIRWFMDTYGEAVTFETAAGAFGSFVDARSILRNGAPSDFKLAARIAEVTTVQQVIQRICEQSLACVTIDPGSGKWLFHAWTQGPAVDYDWTFTREDCADLFHPGVTSNTELAQGVRLNWGFDYFLGRNLFQSYVTEDSSSQGYSQATTRDQRIEIDATNDRFDWKTGAWGGGPFTYADSLVNGTFTDPMDVAADVQDNVLRFRISTASYYTAAGYGHFVRTGFNDSFNFWYGGTPTYYHATLAAGDYSPDEYWALIAATMNATAGVSVFTGSYNHLTNKGTVVSSGSTFGFQSKFTSHTSPGTSAIWTMGFNLGTGSGAAATTVTSAYPIYADRFWMNSEPTATFQLLALTGANVAATCFGALGYDAADDTLGNQHHARLARGYGESEVADNVALNGPHEDDVFDADWIRDEITAQNWRDRRRAFVGSPRKTIRFRTTACPDMQRMRVIDFDASVDARLPYGEFGSDGSWAGKAFRVLEVEKDLGPHYFTEVYAERA